MANLIPLSQLSDTRGYDLKSENVYDPTGETAYGANGEKVGKVREALADGDTGQLRYLVVNVGNWFSSKEVLVPVGMARIEDDAVYFDNLTRDQVKDMQEYHYGMDISEDYERQNVSVFSDRARDVAVMDIGTAPAAGVSSGTVTGSGTADRTPPAAGMTDERLFNTPQRLQLLEERLVVDKKREKAGEVVVSKRVETRPESVNVDVSHEEVVIERRPVTDGRPVESNVTLGSGSDTVRVDVEAERADVRKQAYVAEEVDVSKRSESETRTFNETVGREVLDVEKTGEVEVEGDTSDTASTRKGNKSS